MTTSLQPINQNGAAPYQEPADEFDMGLDPGEARPARLGWNGREGQFTNPLTGEVVDALTAVVLTKLPDTRIMFNPDLKAPKGERVLCRSYDMRNPVDADLATAVGAGPTCAECPFHDFGKDRYGNTVRPPCSPIYTVGIATDDDDPAALLFGTKSLSAKTMRQLISTIENLRIGRKLPPFAYKVELRAGPKVTKENEAYYPLQARVLPERVATDAQSIYANLWRMVRAYDPAAVTPDVDEELEPPVDDGLNLIDPDSLLFDEPVYDGHGEPLADTDANEERPAREFTDPEQGEMAGVGAAQAPASRKGAHG